MSQCHDCALATRPPNGHAHATRTVAIVGPPNSGKSTLFNRLTGLRQKVANYPGVTVEQRVGQARFEGGHTVTLIDLPGVYSLEPRSEDERVAHSILTGHMDGVSKPDAVLLILDSTNLGRNLMLAAPILALGVPVMVLLNMADDLRERGGGVDAVALANELGAPVALISAFRGEGLDPVIQFITGDNAVPAPAELPPSEDIPLCRAWAARMGHHAKYQPPAPPVWTRRLDRLFLHPVLGPLVFVVVVVAVFQSIFTGARPLMDGVQGAVTWSGHWLGSVLPDSPLRSLLIEGVWGGWARCSFSCRRCCCCFSLSASWRIRVTWRARR